MADAKLTALSATTAPVSTDLLYAVTDPGGSPASVKITMANARKALLVGAWSSIGQRSTNNSGTPNTQFDLIADQVVLRNPTTDALVVANSPATITNNVSTAGSTANGRDQAGAFSANSWIHFYWIWDGTTLASVSSTVAPMTGPTLPSGYTHWAYAGPVRFDGSSHLFRVIILRNQVRYLIDEGATNLALNAGNTTTFAAVDLSTWVPPNSREAEVGPIVLGVDTNAGTITQHEFIYRPTGSGLTGGLAGLARTGDLVGGVNTARTQLAQSIAWVVTDSSQSIDYKLDNAFSSSGGVYLTVLGYRVPNNSN